MGGGHLAGPWHALLLLQLALSVATAVAPSGVVPAGSSGPPAATLTRIGTPPRAGSGGASAADAAAALQQARLSSFSYVLQSAALAAAPAAPTGRAAPVPGPLGASLGLQVARVTVAALASRGFALGAVSVPPGVAVPTAAPQILLIYSNLTSAAAPYLPAPNQTFQSPIIGLSALALNGDGENATQQVVPVAITATSADPIRVLLPSGAGPPGRVTQCAAFNASGAAVALPAQLTSGGSSLAAPIAAASPMFLCNFTALGDFVLISVPERPSPPPHPPPSSSPRPQSPRPAARQPPSPFNAATTPPSRPAARQPPPPLGTATTPPPQPAAPQPPPPRSNATTPHSPANSTTAPHSPLLLAVPLPPSSAANPPPPPFGSEGGSKKGGWGAFAFSVGGSLGGAAFILLALVALLLLHRARSAAVRRKVAAMHLASEKEVRLHVAQVGNARTYAAGPSRTRAVLIDTDSFADDEIYF